VALLDDLDAFHLEHRRCGPLDADVEGDRCWIVHDVCGATLNRIDEMEGDR